MTKTITVILALALGFALPALAQSTTTSQPPTQDNQSMGQQPDQSGGQTMQQPNANPPAQAQPNAAGGSSVSTATPDATQTLSGTISADGKTFNSNGNSYVISNPNSVKPFAGKPVTVKYEADTNNSIHITAVMLSHPQQ